MFLIETLSTPRRGASSYWMERRLWLNSGIQGVRKVKMNEDVPLHFSHVCDFFLHAYVKKTPKTIKYNLEIL